MSTELETEDFIEPLSGPAGRFFRQVLQQAGLPVLKLAFCSLTPETDVLLERAGAEWVLLCGEKAVGHWRPDLALRECHGRPFLLNESLVGFPVLHPVAVFRDPATWAPVLTDDLLSLQALALARAKGDWWHLTPDTCVRCRGEWFRVDPQGVVYCEQHWMKHR